MKEKILIIEDDSGVRFFLEEALKGEGYTVFSNESYEEAYTRIDKNIDLIIMDIKLPGVDGLTAIGDIKKRGNTPVIIITAYGTKKNAMEAIRHGAADFFIKPIALNELKVVVRRVLQKHGLTKEMDQIKRDAISGVEFHGVIGKSEAMKDIFKTVEKVAEKDISVLITGETGVGKEVIAGLIYRLSGRKGDFVVVNCASIPDTLLESELFGYEKGAFTGAFQQKQGRFELADRGTIVLDEIGEMSPYLQAKLLRVIENKEIERLGGIKKQKIDIRIIATTNRVLEREMKEGRFREDLYFRLSQMHISIPPLRERKDDIEVLVDSILLSLSKELNHTVSVDNKARKAFIRYNWPGNVRELINVIKRAVFMCEGNHISLDDLPLHLRGDYVLEGRVYTDKSLDEAISELEKKMIMDALKKTRGQQVKAAKLLGISERSMWYRVKKYEIGAVL